MRIRCKWLGTGERGVDALWSADVAGSAERRGVERLSARLGKPNTDVACVVQVVTLGVHETLSELPCRLWRLDETLRRKPWVACRR